MLKTYCTDVLGVATFLAIGSAVAHQRFKTVTGFGVGIVMICVIFLPLVDIFADFDIYKEMESLIGDVEYDVTDSAVEMAFEEGIREYVASEYSVCAECVGVTADGFDLEIMRAERIYVTLSGKGIYLDYKRIETDVSEKFTKGGECEVSLKLG